MDETPERWTAFHFSQGNPSGAGQGDVPALLRRVADTLEAHGAIEVHDLVFHSDVDGDGGDRPYLTVYFTDTGED